MAGTVTIPEPTYSNEIKERHEVRELVARNAQQNLEAAREQQLAMLRQALAGENPDPDLPVKIAELENQMAQAEIEARSRAAPARNSAVSDERLAALDAALRAENEVKKLQVAMLIQLKNLLTAEQVAYLESTRE